jgi:hypothetical protein
MNATIQVSPEDMEVLTRLADSSPDANLRSTLRYALGMDVDCDFVFEAFHREGNYLVYVKGEMEENVAWIIDRYFEPQNDTIYSKADLLAIAARME